MNKKLILMLIMASGAQASEPEPQKKSEIGISPVEQNIVVPMKAKRTESVLLRVDQTEADKAKLISLGLSWLINDTNRFKNR